MNSLFGTSYKEKSDIYYPDTKSPLGKLLSFVKIMTIASATH
jgi:hypothetical protein